MPHADSGNGGWSHARREVVQASSPLSLGRGYATVEEMRRDEPRVNAPVGDVVGLTYRYREQRQAEGKLIILPWFLFRSPGLRLC